MPETHTYLFENRFMYLQCLEKYPDRYESNLGKLLYVLRVLDKTHPDFENDIEQLAQNSQVVLIEEENSRPKAKFIINANDIKTDTLIRFKEGVKRLPQNADKSNILPRIKSLDPHNR